MPTFSLGSVPIGLMSKGEEFLGIPSADRANRFALRLALVVFLISGSCNNSLVEFYLA